VPYHAQSIESQGARCAAGLRSTALDAALGGTWAPVAGEFGCATAPQLQRGMREARDRRQLTVLGLRDLTFVESAGVDTIVNATTGARRIGQRLILVRCRVTAGSALSAYPGR
jgi:anti-anti-sigma factor